MKAITKIEQLATVIRESKRKTDDIISTAAQIHGIVGLKSTCVGS